MTDNSRRPSQIERFLLHIHPQNVNATSIKFTRTFGLGGIAALLLLILFITGIVLRFYYIPTPEAAYDSIINLKALTFGKLFRNIHYLSATALVLVTFLHVLRIFYSNAYQHERAKNWIYGIVLFILVIFANFTGYLLPWDQLAYWAVTVMTNMLEYFPIVGSYLADWFRGSTQVDGNTLLNFYNLHTGLIPLLFVFLLSVHFWLVRKAKGVAVPDGSDTARVATFPNLVIKEVITALIVIGVIFLLSIFIDAPLLDKANPDMSPNPSKAPWYFLGAQEFLLHVHPFISAFLAPVALIATLFYLPFFKGEANTGVWFNGETGKTTVILSAIFSIVLTLLLVFASEYFFRTWHALPDWINQGIVPILNYVIPILGWIWFLKSKYKINALEIRNSVFTIIWVSYLIMLVIAKFFRAEGMQMTL